MRVIVEGHDLPGMRCNPDAEGHGHVNVHVGLATKANKTTGVEPIPGRPWGISGLTRGDASEARWDVDVEVKRRPDGTLDFGGPYVRGNAGDRHLGLFWGEVDLDGTFNVFRGTKLKLETVDPELIAQAEKPGAALVARIRLTDRKGNPLAATAKTPALTWMVTGSSR